MRQPGALRQQPTRPPAKCISLAGHGSLIAADGDPNDYRLYGNREYIRDRSRTGWVKLWVPWDFFQQELRPASRTESWTQLNGAPGGQAAMRRLDRQVAAANADGVHVMLTLPSIPTWANGAQPADRERYRKALNARPPVDTSPTSPWAWYVGYICARYRKGAPPNPVGPTDPLLLQGASAYDPRTGNPDGAFVDAVEISNEPNQVMYPQTGMPERIAAMIVSAVAVSQELDGPRILAPGTSDTDGAGDRANWREFTRATLAALGDFTPGARFGWSHHNYRDTLEELTAERSRAKGVIDLLHASGVRGDGALWLTESGVDMYPRQNDPGMRRDQARLIEKNFGEMSRLPEVRTWTQHVINDTPFQNFKSGLRDDFHYHPDGPGPPRPSYDAWAALPVPA